MSERTESFALNAAGGEVPTRAGICLACQLAKMLERGVMTASADAGHSDCEGTRVTPCTCGCDFSLGVECKECLRKGTDLDDKGQCVDRRACSNEIFRLAAAQQAKRRDEVAKAPTRRPGGGGSGQKRPCTCGCGETTGGGLYRPGHDARHVSALAKAVKAGDKSADQALRDLEHSVKLQDKFRKATA